MFVVTLLMVSSAVAESQFLAAGGQSIESYCALLVELARDQRVTQDNCGILRGPRDRRKIALIFTGGSFAEGYADVHRALTALNVKASFFFTDDFLRTDEFQPLVHELLSEGHYIGPHSDRHLTLVNEHGRTLVSRNVFDSDLRNNLTELARSGVDLKNISFWIPPNEAYNREISEWSFELGVELFNFSPGTYSNTDYLGDHEPGFTDNETIEKSILDLAARPGGLNGFLLLLHLGAGPERTVQFSTRLPALLPQLAQMGYNFVRVDEMLTPELARSIGRRRGDR
ncbi:MAG TPA: polysaccharide deacetylase family protein [Xanthobacteraceae bacterium]|nr:polysaccharide deacetylase family protein [Xanthobacteraceae bacterium]